MNNSQYAELIHAIQKSGQILLKYFGQQLHLTQKSTHVDYQTRADIETEEYIIGAIEKIFPQANIIGEENGKIVFGVVHHPVTNQTYWAVKGEGAYLDDERIRVNSENNPKNMTMSYYCEYRTPIERVRAIKRYLQTLDVKRVLDLWAPGFCFSNLAAGNMEAIIVDGIEFYDFAAGKLIAKEAGAIITNFNGTTSENDRENQFVISYNADIQDFVIGVIRELFPG